MFQYTDSVGGGRGQSVVDGGGKRLARSMDKKGLIRTVNKVTEKDKIKKENFGMK